MKSRYHFATSLLFSLMLICYYEFFLALLVILIGWLIDVDHEIDYYTLNGKFVFNPTKLANELSHLFCNNATRMFCFFHGYEWIIVGVLLGIPILILIPYALHLVMDIVGNGLPAHQMSLLWRWRNGWRINFRRQRN